MESQKQGLYNRYTSTSSLAGVDENSLLSWSAGYFRYHYSILLPRDKNSRILEVGCGYGRYIKTLSEMGYLNTYGIDISEEQIEYARKRIGLKNVERADAFHWLEEKESEFDCILALDVFEHIETEALLELGQKIYKALKPGGRIIVQVPNAMSPLNPIPYGDLTHVRAFTAQSMQQFFLYLGFVPEQYLEIPPYVHDLKSGIHRILWSYLLKPSIATFVRLVHGRVMGGSIYTANFIAAAQKSSISVSQVGLANKVVK